MENVPVQDYQQEEAAQEHMAQVTENVVEGTKEIETVREPRHLRASETERRHGGASEISTVFYQ